MVPRRRTVTAALSLHTDKKEEEKIFLIHKEIQKGSVAKS